MVSVLIEEIEMSDAIREAFEALEQARHKFELCGAMFEFDTVKSALQSQTAPAVPEDGHALAKIIKDAHMEGQKSATGREGTEFRWAHSDAKVTADIFLAAASQPDHIADAGKVVQGELVGWVVEREGDSTFPLFYFDRAHAENMVREVELLPFATMHPVYTHPAESREEIQAQALESYADQLDVVFANAQRAGANDCPAWHAGQFAKDARKQAARLRASQQEGSTAGDDGEGE